MQHHQALAIVLLAAIVDCADVATKDSVYQYVSANGTSRTKDILKCVSDSDFACVLDKVEAVLIEKKQRLLEEADKRALATIPTASGRNEEQDSKPSVLMDAIGSLVSEISEILFKGGLSGFFRDAKEEETADLEDDEEEDEDEDDDEEGDDDEEADSEVQETQTTSPAERNGRLAEVEQRGDIARRIKHRVRRRKKRRKKRRKRRKDRRKKKKHHGNKKFHILMGNMQKITALAGLLLAKKFILLKTISVILQLKFFILAIIGLVILIQNKPSLNVSHVHPVD